MRVVDTESQRHGAAGESRSNPIREAQVGAGHRMVARLGAIE